MNRRISLPFSFTQDYRAASEVPPPLYTETFSIGKIDIEKSKRMIIKDGLVQNYFFRSTQALTNPVTLGLILSDNLELQLNDGFTKLLDIGTGLFTETVLPNTPFPGIKPSDKIARLQSIVCYEDILEYETYVDENDFSDPQYELASASKLLMNNSTVDTLLLNGTTYPVPGEIEIYNPSGKRFLYLVPYTPKLQRTRVGTSGRFNFTIYSLLEEE
ncbi:MAG: hypothetical protein SH817_10375 [Leptospira sp.]|nr:hypothetical protein [Leptospira sp.]